MNQNQKTQALESRLGHFCLERRAEYGVSILYWLAWDRMQ
jgi:hypothetical protein